MFFNFFNLSFKIASILDSDSFLFLIILLQVSPLSGEGFSPGTSAGRISEAFRRFGYDHYADGKLGFQGSQGVKEENIDNCTTATLVTDPQICIPPEVQKKSINFSEFSIIFKFCEMSRDLLSMGSKSKPPVLQIGEYPQ
ncbi:hypothetical protein OSB04_013013 [Centaurea solstitialis]|uniref:Uncharacterized protein n=1 Tax=Centaurea solstitialis TaxID=347529 RepID=A0AA38TE68_9ASTR|nr:hypothetical protein OSB04_013013 [Centaurea solstitialis]